MPALLERPQETADALPERFLDATRELEDFQEETSRLLGTTPTGSSYWLVESATGSRPRLCLIGRLPSGIGGAGCGTVDQYQRGDMRLIIEEGPALIEDGVVTDRELIVEGVVLLPENSNALALPEGATRVGDLISIGGPINQFQSQAADLVAANLDIVKTGGEK